MLERRETELASRLINIYFTLFELYVTKGEVESKMLDALLTGTVTSISFNILGINRAFPYSPYDETEYNSHIDSLFKIVHISSFNKGVQVKKNKINNKMVRPFNCFIKLWHRETL